MAGLAKLIAAFLAPIVRELAKVVIAEWRKPVEGEMVGGGPDVAADVNAGVDDALDSQDS